MGLVSFSLKLFRAIDDRITSNYLCFIPHAVDCCDVDYLYFVDIRPKTAYVEENDVTVSIHKYNGKDDYRQVFGHKRPLFKGTWEDLLDRYTE